MLQNVYLTLPKIGPAMVLTGHLGPHFRKGFGETTAISAQLPPSGDTRHGRVTPRDRARRGAVLRAGPAHARAVHLRGVSDCGAAVRGAACLRRRLILV